MTRWLLIVALLGCNKPKAQQTPQLQVGVCPRVADHLVSLMSGATKHPPEATDPLRRVIDERCAKDAWTAETNQCLLSLTSLTDGEKCQAMMTQAQVEAFHRDSEAATVELRGQFSENPPKDGSPSQLAPRDAPADD